MGDKIYILDTNVILQDPNALNSFQDNEIIIPSIVLEETDSKKRYMDEIGRNARHFSRILDGHRANGKLHEGVKLESGGTLKVVLSHKTSIEMEDYFKEITNDNKILSVALRLKDEQSVLAEGKPVIVVSKDALVRVKADALGIIAEDYQHDKVVSSVDDKYTGYTEAKVDSEVIDQFFRRGSRVKSPIDVPENHFVHLKGYDGKQSAITTVKNGNLEKLYNYSDTDIVFGIQSKNMQQDMAFELLLNDNIPLVTISGKAGTGKTLITLASALKQTLDDKIYKKVIVARPVIPMGKDIGFLPGEMEEKLRPWMQPIYDNLEFLFNAKDSAELDKMMSGMQGELQVEALTYIRGRSIPNQFIIIDEAQNLTQHEVKTILTRVGEGSKIVLMGDPEQIDHPYLDQYNNGLTYVIETMKDVRESGHITLKRGERSTLAQLCADML